MSLLAATLTHYLRYLHCHCHYHCAHSTTWSAAQIAAAMRAAHPTALFPLSAESGHSPTADASATAASSEARVSFNICSQVRPKKFETEKSKIERRRHDRIVFFVPVLYCFSFSCVCVFGLAWRVSRFSVGGALLVVVFVLFSMPVLPVLPVLSVRQTRTRTLPVRHIPSLCAAASHAHHRSAPLVVVAMLGHRQGATTTAAQFLFALAVSQEQCVAL